MLHYVHLLLGVRWLYSTLTALHAFGKFQAVIQRDTDIQDHEYMDRYTQERIHEHEYMYEIAKIVVIFRWKGYQDKRTFFYVPFFCYVEVLHQILVLRNSH